MDEPCYLQQSVRVSFFHQKVSQYSATTIIYPRYMVHKEYNISIYNILFVVHANINKTTAHDVISLVLESSLFKVVACIFTINIHHKLRNMVIFLS